MKVSCPSCQTNYNIDDRRIPPGGAKLKCARCQTTFPIKADGVSAEAPETAPTAAPPSAAAPQAAAIPLPGTAAPQAAAIPLPGTAAPQAAIPLPGSAAPQPAAIPLPGSAAPRAAAIPLPGTAAPQAAAIPLPGSAAPRAAAIPLPGSAAPQPAAIPMGAGPAAIPLPGSAAPPAAAIPMGSGPSAIPLPGTAAPQAAAIPLPGTAAPRATAIPLGASPTASAAIPLPGTAAPQAAAIPLPGSAAPRAAAIPLPGSAAPPAAAIPMGAGPAAIPLPGSAAPQSAAIPLPGTAAPRAAAIPLGASPTASAAIPLPGAAAPQSAAIPLPGSAAPRAAAIPLPGNAAPPVPEDPFSFDDDVPPAAFASPGVAAPRAISLDAGPAAPVALPDDSFSFDMEAAPPAPQAAEDDFAEVGSGEFSSLDTSDFSEPREDVTRVVAIPVPTAAFREPTAPVAYGSQEPSGTARDFDFSEDPIASTPDPETDFGSTPDFDFSEDANLPVPVQAAEDAFTFDINDPSNAHGPGAPRPQPQTYGYGMPAEPQADPFALAPPPAEPEADPFGLPPPSSYAAPAPIADPFALPPPPSAGASPYDLGDLPAAGEAPFALPPSPGLDFSDLPSPASPPAMDFSDLPSPAAPASFDFADPPPAYGQSPVPDSDPFAVDFTSPPASAAPAPDFSLDFGDPAPPPPARVNPMTDFGDVDFGDPAPVPASAATGLPDALEFDPTAAPADDLEADLSAPLPPPPAAGPTDGLEMLSFIDDSAGKEAGGRVPVKRFHVRRRSGKMFGPFEEGVIVKMLEDGQLLGNEDVSPDSEAWSAIGTVPIFASAIQRLMEGPAKAVPLAATAAAASPDAPGADPANPQASMERLRQLYEGRMAAVSVVDRSAADLKWKKRLPIFIAAGVSVLVLGTGASFEASRYGAFGRNKLFPARVSAGSSEAKLVEEARKGLLEDTYASYKEARTKSAQVLATKEYPEVRALWCQSVAYLQRRYADGERSDLTACGKHMETIELLGEKNVEVLKTAAAIALTNRKGADVQARLQDAYSREDNQGDWELAFLLAETYAQQKDIPNAITTLTKVLEKNPKSAKAHHALGNLYQAQGKADEAAKAYADALAADPQHAASAVELAAVELLVRKANIDQGAQAVESALKLQDELGPAERARARGLKGVALFQQFKPKEAETELKAALKDNPDSSFIKAQLALVLRSQRDYDGALPLYASLAKEDSANLEYVDGHITALVMTGKMQDALTAVEAASKSFPNEARIAYLYGRIEDALDKPTEAEGHFKRATAADAKLVDAGLYLGRLYLRQHRNADARALLEAAAQQAPDHAGVHAGLGELALAENNSLLAQQEFDRAVQLDPNLADAHLGLSRVALLGGDAARAETEANRALELDPHLLKDGRLQRGLVLWRLHRLDEAAAELEKAKQEDPRSTTTPITLGAVLLEKGDLGGAESNLGLALRNEPSNHEALYYLGLVRAKRSEYTQALDSMKTAVDRAPKRPDYHYAYGVILRDAKRLPDAIEQWQAAVALDSHYADAHEALGHAFLERGEFDNAIASFEAALKADPQRTRVMGAMGDVLFNAARWDDAVRRYQAALKADPKLTYVYYKVARAYTEQAQHAKAIDWYKKATAAEPENPQPFYYLGFAYKERNKRKDAITAFKEYLAKKPGAADKKDIEDEIYDLEH
ncbi:tetratricopeptide repeat protein [Corallococcus sp. Z5C101001]|uniref:tetratricopeptide repeat protein n=1 Tax=Corallococcus sp. Z5C101001 TaxID=2596829 RepID=UPI00117FE3A7|nr:tetratricopeptide repeat protein [Corallococcus sp. Z5C101001]TSC34475.1 tetratricopeptide repeat protein [Corallococcus sp. Z5C101001]